MHPHPTYRALTRLYPREFRDRYREDRIQHHSDLAHSGGPVAAWSRSGLDLIITIPRYHLERIMDQRHVTQSSTGTRRVLTIDY